MLFEADYAKNYASIMYQCLALIENGYAARFDWGIQTWRVASCQSFALKEKDCFSSVN